MQRSETPTSGLPHTVTHTLFHLSFLDLEPITVIAFSPKCGATSPQCGLTLTCPRNTSTPLRPCSANETADFDVLRLSLQTCQDISYFFNNGQPWPIDDKTLYCRVSTPCGRLVPYITSSNISTNMCDKFSQYASVIDTFRDLCCGEPVQNIVGDNGLLAELRAGNGTRKPTPAPTCFRVDSVAAPTDSRTTGTDAASSAVHTVPMLLTLVSFGAIAFA